MWLREYHMQSVCSKTQFSKHTASLEISCSEKFQETPDSNPPFPETGESLTNI